MECLKVKILRRTLWLGRSTSRWRTGASDESCSEGSSARRSIWGLQRSRLEIERWSWRKRLPRVEVKNNLFGLSQLYSVQCKSLTDTRYLKGDRDEKRSRGIEAQKKNVLFRVSRRVSRENFIHSVVTDTHFFEERRMGTGKVKYIAD